jgi:hypothetical protein
LILSRPCRAVDVEREKKPVVTYMIEGADVNKGTSTIADKYKVNKNDDSNSLPTTDTSYKTFGDESLYMEPLSSKSLITMNNDGNSSPPLSHRNMPVTLDTISDAIDGNRMMKNHNPFPLSSSIPLNPQAVPTSMDNDMYRYNTQQPTDPLYFAPSSLSQSRYPPVNSGPTEPYVRKTATPLRKHPRWVLRLSQPREIHSVPLPRSRPFSSEQPRNKLSSSSRSTATIPRYMVSPEQ